MVPDAGVPWLVARRSIASEVATIIGPILGGLLYVAGAWVALVAVAALSVVGAAAILAIRVPDLGRLRTIELSPAGDDEVGHVLEQGIPASRGGLHEALEGLRFVRTTPVLLGAISLDLFAVLFGGAVTLLPAIAVRLHVGAVGLGWLRASVGLGAGATTLLISVRPIERRVGPVLLTAVACFGVWTIVLGFARSYALAFIAMFALSAADAVSVFIRSTLVPLATPPGCGAGSSPSRTSLSAPPTSLAASNRACSANCWAPPGRSSSAASPRWSWRSPGACSSPRSGELTGSPPHLLAPPRRKRHPRANGTVRRPAPSLLLRPQPAVFPWIWWHFGHLVAEGVVAQPFSQPGRPSRPRITSELCQSATRQLAIPSNRAAGRDQRRSHPPYFEVHPSVTAIGALDVSTETQHRAERKRKMRRCYFPNWRKRSGFGFWLAWANDLALEPLRPGDERLPNGPRLQPKK